MQVPVLLFSVLQKQHPVFASTFRAEIFGGPFHCVGTIIPYMYLGLSHLLNSHTIAMFIFPITGKTV